MIHNQPLTSTRSERLKTVLAQIHHFENLPPKVQQGLAASAVLHRYNAGQVIYLEGEPAGNIYLLERGWIKATRMSRDGREQAMLFLESGEIFGVIAVFSRTTYPGTVVALEAVDVWAIPAGEFLALLERYPELAMAVISHLSDRIMHYIGLVEDLSLRNVEARLANTLLQHAEEHDGLLIVPRRDWTTFDEMAVRLGTVRDVLSRGLKKLEGEGLLKVDKQAIVLLDPKGLAERGRL
jgi:CRP-like cAMP-binding protein